ncbi:Haloalkane dehalogenase [Anatilimnocola aggregata]|uniref:Haloalkane dehalogenase n=1 Tax=Anatilimnocola aggregata TaxID=2528021 RepID=A0A517Y9K6_9BACT|nr:alpha/beta fold hydrolase [Anatilimnocola aggregata]QDU26914.1 Haloalkane dehalogenase [Anatilimnocola aggregata]
MSADWRPLYPFASHFLPIGGAQMHYLDEGTKSPGANEPLLMVHGNPTWSFYWRNLVIGLRDQNRCVVPDHIGCGLSDKPQQYNYYTFAQHIQNLIELIEKLDLRNITLLAHDWGGAIGMGAATKIPERFARIVLFNTGAFPPMYIPWRIAALRLPGFGKVAIQGFNVFARSAIHMATEKPERMTPEVQAGLLAPYDNWANRIANYRFVKNIPMTRRHPSGRKLAEIESSLWTFKDRPISLIWGMRDWCFNPRCLARFEQHWPNAEVHRLDDCGHYVIEDAHERIIPIVQRFLANHPLADG